MRRATFLSVPIAAAPVAAACGGGATPRGAATDAPRTVQIEGTLLVESGIAGATAAPRATPGAPSQTARPTAMPMGSMGEGGR